MMEQRKGLDVCNLLVKQFKTLVGRVKDDCQAQVEDLVR